MSSILVVGASGKVGAELARLLNANGHRVKRATSSREPAADQVHLDLVEPKALDLVFDGVDKAFLLSPPGYTNQNELLKPLIEQAKRSNLKKVVLMTAMGANAVEEAPLRQAEIQLERSGLDYNIVRPNWFMQNFNSFWLHGIESERKIFLPVGNAKGSFIDARDIAAVAASLLERDEYGNQAFDLTGGEALDHDEVAAILSGVTQETITFEDISPDEMLQNLLGAQLPRPYAEFMIMILGFFKAGYSERITGAVEQITGGKPITFAQYASDHRDAWLKKAAAA